MVSKLKYRDIATIIVTSVVLIVSFSWFLFDSEDISSVILQNYSLGLFIYTAYIVSSVVFVTFPMIPLLPFILSVYGLDAAILFTFLGVNIGAYISFFISRKFGRDFVMDKIGKNDYEKYDQIASISSFFHFLTLRLIANNYFDIVSYIGGLSKISQKDFLISTAISSLIWISISFKILDSSLSQGKEITLVALGLFYAAIGLVAIFLVGRFFVLVRKSKKEVPSKIQSSK